MSGCVASGSMTASMAREQQRHVVSVVIPAFKAAATIAKAVQGCLGDEAVREIIVVVDGPDEALQAAIPPTGCVRTIVNPSTLGAPAARNAGLGAATGDFVLFLDADDYVEGGSISALAQAGAREQADIVLGSFAFELASGRRIFVDIAKAMVHADAIHVLKAWFTGHFVPPCSVLWRASFVRGIGGWNEEMLKNQDGELLWRACRNHPRIAFAPAARGIYVQGRSQHRVSRNMSQAMFEQQVALLGRIESDLSRDDFLFLRPEIGAMYYHLARLAYYHDHIGIGALAESAARRLGFAGHSGSIVHRGFAAMLGLRMKERLCGRLHRIEQALGLLRPRVRLLSGIEQ